MNLKKLEFYFVIVLLLGSFMVGKVNAEAIGLSCVDTGTSRSSLTVVGTGLTGSHYVIVASNGIGYKSALKIAGSTGRLVFKFDSNSTAVEQGATYVPAAFIKNLRAVAYLRRSNHTLVAGIMAICTAK